MDKRRIRKYLLIGLMGAIITVIGEMSQGLAETVAASDSMTKKAFNDMIRALGAFAGVMIVKIGNGMKRYLATFCLT